MNRRDFLKRGFQIGAAGLLLPVIEPVRKVWALDRTMMLDPMKRYTNGVPDTVWYVSGRFDANFCTPLIHSIAGEPHPSLWWVEDTTGVRHYPNHRGVITLDEPIVIARSGYVR